MTTGEDFGYIIGKEKHSKFSIAKQPLKLAAVLISAICFVLLTLSAYYFATQGDGSIQLVKSPEHEIKVKNNNSDLKIKNIDKTIYNNIVGNKRDDFKQRDITVIKTPKSAKPVKSTEVNILPREVKKKKEVKERVNVVTNGDLENIKRPYSRVQLAALQSESSAYQYWSKLKKSYPKLFVDLKYFIQKVDLGKRGVFYRLQIGHFRNQIKAEEFCVRFIARAKKRKSDCIIVE